MIHVRKKGYEEETDTYKKITQKRGNCEVVG